MEGWIPLAPTGKEWTFLPSPPPPKLGFRAGTPMMGRSPNLIRGSWEDSAGGKKRTVLLTTFFLYWFCPSEPLGDLRKKQDLPTNDPRSQISFGSENKFWNIFQPEICGVKSWLRHWVISSWKYRVCSTGFLMPFIGFSRFLGWIYLRRPVGQGQHQQLSLHIRRGPWEAF